MKWIGVTTNGNYIIELSPEYWQVIAESGVGDDAPIGEAIRVYRKAQGITQAQMAKRVGISRNYLSMIERDTVRNYSHDTYIRIIAEIATGDR